MMEARTTHRGAGLSVFFPVYNDSGTIASLVINARRTAQKLTTDFEIIIVNDGSADRTADIADELAATYPEVRVIHHSTNRGYGSALRSGFSGARKDFVFYTNGDAQYDPAELEGLWPAMTTDVDLVNGYKISRSDPVHRIVMGCRRLFRTAVDVATLWVHFVLLRRHRRVAVLTSRGAAAPNAAADLRHDRT